MGLNSTPEQDELRAVLRKLLADQYPTSRVREVWELPGRCDLDLHRQLAREFGSVGMLAPASVGGMEMTLADQLAVLEEVGAALVASPVIPTILASQWLLAADDRGAQADRVRQLINGGLVAAVVWSDDGDLRHADGRVSGTASAVISASVADLFVVAAREDTGGQQSMFLVEAPTTGVTVEPVSRLDLTRPASSVSFDGVEAIRVGAVSAADQTEDWLRDLGRILLAAEMAGGARASLDRAVAYAKQRRQFARPIGSFQALKHRLANMLVDVESLTSVLALAGTVDHTDRDAVARIGPLAKAVASRVFRSVADSALHVHGGMGFTWEDDSHLYARRAKDSALLLGDVAEQRSRLVSSGAAFGPGLTVPDPEELQTFRAEARAWLAEHGRPRTGPPSNVLVSGATDGDDARARAWLNELNAGGWAAITWPEEAGGRGLTTAHQAVWDEEIAGYEDHRDTFTISLTMAGPVLMSFGTTEQQQRFLPKMLTGEELWVQLFSEPGAGSDLASLRTTAVRDGDSWVVNGQKIWSSGAMDADWGILLARTEPNAPKHRGITFFLVDMATPGVQPRPVKQIPGGAHFCEVFLDDVVIPAENVVGEVNRGWMVSLATLAHERGSIASPTLMNSFDFAGLAELVVASTDNDPRSVADVLVRQRLAEVFELREVIRLFGTRTRERMLQASEPPGAEVSIGKLLIARLGSAISDLATDLTGWHGLAGDGKWVLDWLAAPAFHIAGGTDEVQLSILGERVLGLPSEARTDKEPTYRELAASGALG